MADESAAPPPKRRQLVNKKPARIRRRRLTATALVNLFSVGSRYCSLAAREDQEAVHGRLDDRRRGDRGSQDLPARRENRMRQIRPEQFHWPLPRDDRSRAEPDVPAEARLADTAAVQGEVRTGPASAQFQLLRQ